MSDEQSGGRQAMARFFIAPGAVRGEQVTLDAIDSHHLLRVLRARLGDAFVAVAPGVAHRCVLVAADGGLAVGRIAASAPAGGEPPVAVTLLQGLCKGEKMELIMQKATELGVAAIVPVACQRSVEQLEAKRAAERVERWQRIAREAAQQCRRGAVPSVAPVAEWRAAAAAAPQYDLALVFWEAAAPGAGAQEEAAAPGGPEPAAAGGVPGLRAALAAAPAARRIAIFVGPEGGLTEAEVAQATAAGAVTTHLGPRILRTETAGIAALAAILFERGDLGG